MLKWTVYGKKNQHVPVIGDENIDNVEPYSNKPYSDIARRSLDAQTVKKSKKPSRYQRRSLGAAARKNNCQNVDKENFNFIGNTPNHFREGYIKKSESNALKDVSNITPTPMTPNYDKINFYKNSSKDNIIKDLPPTPPTYSRRVREAKKRKLEMSACNNNEIFTRNICIYKSERRMKQDRSLINSSKLSHSISEPSLNDLSERLSASTENNRNSIAIAKQHILNKKPISTTTAKNEDLAEIEYDRDLVLNCVEKPLNVDKNKLEKSTLPIFGHRVFTDNPLYFSKYEDGPPNIRPLKRTRKKSSDFESCFKSPSVDRRDLHTLVREGCSPLSITPLSVKLAALRFSTMSSHTQSQRVPICDDDVVEYFPKIENPTTFTIPLKDEECSTEMENKFILGKESLNSVSESTVSTTEMGDITLEKMIEDIIKSTKIIKSKRRIFNRKIEKDIDIQEEIPTVESVKDLFVKPQTKTNVIKEARYVNLSRENSVSPKATPTKKRTPIHRVNDKLLKNVPIGGFILDDGDGYNEREVRTPDNYVDKKYHNISLEDDLPLLRSQSMKSSKKEETNLKQITSESTPDLYAATNICRNNRLRRQKCIRRKKSTASNESLWKPKQTETKSSLVLTLEMGLPSPACELQNTSLCEPFNASYQEFLPEIENINQSLRSNVSHSSLKTRDIIQNIRSRELFGLTLEAGIPSPITPLPNLKRTSNVLSEERAHKTSKLGEELLPNDIMTPVLEHKTSRRCLTYSPEESSINSSEEKRISVASNRLERSSDRFQALKATIDLEIVTRNDVIDVHGEW